AQLLDLEASRTTFDALGVQTVVVLDMRAGSAARMVRRLNYGGGTVVDPQCAIADLYSSLDPTTLRNAPACFVIDGGGRLRGAVRGTVPAARELVSFTARSLGLAMPGTAFSSMRIE